MRFSMTDTLLLAKTSEREQGTVSSWPFSHVNTRLTLRYSEYRAMFEEISNSTRLPRENCSWNWEIRQNWNGFERDNSLSVSNRCWIFETLLKCIHDRSSLSYHRCHFHLGFHWCSIYTWNWIDYVNWGLMAWMTHFLLKLSSYRIRRISGSAIVNLVWFPN